MDISHAVPLGSNIQGINVDTVPNYVSFQHFDTHPFTKSFPIPMRFQKKLQTTGIF